MYRVVTGIDFLYGIVIGLTSAIVNYVLNFFSNADEQIVLLKEDNEPQTDFIHNEVADDGPQTFRAVGEILHAENRTEISVSAIQKNTIMYTDSVRVPVYKNPTIEFDMQIAEIPYGEMVLVLEPKGRFFHIVWRTIDGWVLKDTIADRATRVYPEFRIGEENTVDSFNTTHIRVILNDIFGLSRSEFPLQAGEYVLYKLWKRGVIPAWPDTRPRTPGTWHKILKGMTQVHVGVLPKVGTIMEYIYDAEIGHVAYVEAVYPDNSISISEVNLPEAGIYNERKLSKEDWKSLHPVFISIQ